ncbi:Tsi6 [compost metagenome]
MKYIKAVFDGTEKDKSKLHRLTIGAIASKEFEENDPELARVLKDAYYVAIQSAHGLKIQLPD